MSWVVIAFATLASCTKSQGKACTDECSLAELRCAGTLIQSCAMDNAQCFYWGQPYACPTGQACDSGTNQCSCAGECSLGEARCYGSGRQTCILNGNGCPAWGNSSLCPSGKICDVATSQCVIDQCQGVPREGVCDSATVVKLCTVPTGESVPRVVTYSCAAGEGCQVQGGIAQCVVVGVCRDGETECVSSTELSTCTSGDWVASTCPTSCKSSPLGAFCVPTTPLVDFTGTVTYEARVPNADRTDWTATTSKYSANGLLVQSMSGAGTVYDAAYSGPTGGALSIKVPQTPAADDYVIVAAAADDGSGVLAYGVIDPGFTDAGAQPAGSIGANVRLWQWAWKASDLTPGAELLIKETSGSGAATVYDNLRYAYALASRSFGKPGSRVLVWVGLNTTWDCWGCFAPWPINAFDLFFPNQIWLSGGTDQGYWADAVTDHELGHWVMQAYGTSPNEGGTHYLGVPTFPGQAWSEGFATWFSTQVRTDPIMTDKQQGTMFWFNISDRTPATMWIRPTPAGGLLQRIEENEVSAMLWSLSASSGTASQSIYTALASPRMNTSPFGRGYTRHQWTVPSPGQFTDVVDTGESQPHFADLLDALNCAGFPRSTIDAATQPSTYYPYPSSSPICPAQTPRVPITVKWVVSSATADRLSLVARVESLGSFALPVAVSVHVPDEVSVVEGPLTYVVPPFDRPSVHETRFVFAVARAPSEDLLLEADVRTSGFGLHAKDAYTFGRAALRPATAPNRLGPHLRVGGRDFGPSVLMTP